MPRTEAGAAVVAPPAEIRLLARTGFMLHKIGLLLSAAAETALAQHGMRLRYFYVLAALENSDEFSQQDLATMLGVDPTSMVTLVDEMESRGHVNRRRNPSDRRRYILRLTDEGRAELSAASRSIVTLEDDFLSGLEPDSRDQLRTTLSTLMRHESSERVECD